MKFLRKYMKNNENPCCSLGIFGKCGVFEHMSALLAADAHDGDVRCLPALGVLEVHVRQVGAHAVAHGHQVHHVVPVVGAHHAQQL